MVSLGAAVDVIDDGALGAPAWHLTALQSRFWVSGLVSASSIIATLVLDSGGFRVYQGVSGWAVT